MYIARKLETTLLQYMEKREILAVIGPRQSGKTTLLQKIQSNLKDSVFLSFEDRDELELFELDIKGFAARHFHRKYIFIDEFQYAKSGGKNLKYLYDAHGENKIIISGSSAVDLTIHAVKFLVGRVFVFHLYPLDFEEYLSFKDGVLCNLYKKIKKAVDLRSGRFSVPDISLPLLKQVNRLLEEFILWGGYPRVVSAGSEEEKRLVLRNIYNTYFLRDIRDTLGLTDDFKLSRLIKALSLQTGQLIEYNELCRLSGYDHVTLKRHLNILEKTFICRMIKPFFQNKRSELTKNPKIYFYDTGLRNHVIDNFQGMENRLDKGFLYENYVFVQLLKYDIPAGFWRTKAKAEVDFVIEISDRILPIEVKSGISRPLIGRALYSFIEAYKPGFTLVLNSDLIKHTQERGADVYFLPHWAI